MIDDNDDDDEGDGGDDSDADSWLVDDDNDDVEAVAPVDGPDPPPFPKRRLEGTSGAGNSYKKRRVVPLIPFVKGPVWDPSIAKTVEEVFTPFRVRFFNGMLLIALLRSWFSQNFFPRPPLPNRPIHICLVSGNGASGSCESTVPRPCYS